jgi:hypothetical protein
MRSSVKQDFNNPSSYRTFVSVRLQPPQPPTSGTEPIAGAKATNEIKRSVNALDCCVYVDDSRMAEVVEKDETNFVRKHSQLYM